MKALPEIKKVNGYWQFLVDEKPFVALTGELHNSSSYSLEYMEKSVWPYLRTLNLNSVILPIFWDLIEPKEGEFDFEVLDGILEQARREDKKIILLWFGLWKNGLSTYIPFWAKTDKKRFPLCRDFYGKPLNTVSPLSEEAVAADQKAFTELMKHLKAVDEETQTVILVQVENEIGLLGSDRDFSDMANKAYKDQIPQALTELYGKSGTWEEAFGDEAPEYFMEYYYAAALQKIGSAGKNIYQLPMYVNAWLEQLPYLPGTYPSGGPIARFEPLWKKVAPIFVAVAPDIYVSDVDKVFSEYASDTNPLIIPEIRKNVKDVGNILYAIGKYNALVYSPFGIEDLCTPPNELTGMSNPILLKMLGGAINIDTSAFNGENTGYYLPAVYGMVSQMQNVIRNAREEGRLYAFMRKNEHDLGEILHLKHYDLQIKYMPLGDGKPTPSGIVIEGTDNDFYVIGGSMSVSLLNKRNDHRELAIATIEEGSFLNDIWVKKRVLNGDEQYFVMMLDMPQEYHIKAMEL